MATVATLGPSGVSDSPPPLGMRGTAGLFGGGALLLLAVTHAIIPALAAATDTEPVLLWFLAGGLGVFLPLLATALVMLRQEGVGVWTNPRRLWLRKMEAIDWAWSVAGIAAVAAFGATALTLMQLWWGDVRLGPSFLTMTPLTPGRYWILAAWLPYWALNILGEEILWRGVILPRQERAFGRWAWVANGGGWLLFHVAFGTAILATLWPMLFILPYLVQRQRNSWIGVVIHAGINGPGFIAAALGFV